MSKAKQNVHMWPFNLPFDILSSLAKTCTLDLSKELELQINALGA